MRTRARLSCPPMRLQGESIATFASRPEQFVQKTKIQTASWPYLQPKIPEFDRKALGLQCDLPRAARQRLHMILQDTIDEGDDLRVLRVDLIAIPVPQRFFGTRCPARRSLALVEQRGRGNVEPQAHDLPGVAVLQLAL